MAKPRKNIVFYILSLIYGGITSVRNVLFDKKILSSTEFQFPVIGIGNLAVGGTGKTPHTEFFLKKLNKHFQTAVLSRGYKRLTKGFVLADETSDAERIGDEPFQIFSKFPETILAVDEKRVRGVSELMRRFPGIDVVLLDDSFQHRAIRPGLNILLTDFNLLFTEDKMLPYGTLREYAGGSKRADIVIVTKCPHELDVDASKVYREKLNLLPQQELYFSTVEYGAIYPIFEETTTVPEISKEMSVFVVTGIENPAPMHQYLEKFSSKVEKFVFPDHHRFTEPDLLKIKEKIAGTSGEKIIITTEKDAARLKTRKEIPTIIKNNIFALPLEVKILLDEEEKLTQKIYDYVRKN